MARTLDQAVMTMAACFNLVGLAVGYFYTPYGYLLSLFVGLNLLQASFTGFCPAVKILRKMGFAPGTAFK